jgi:hypothetical protein
VITPSCSGIFGGIISGIDRGNVQVQLKVKTAAPSIKREASSRIPARAIGLAQYTFA